MAILNEEVNVPQNGHTIPFLYRVANNLASEEEARAEAMYLIAQIQTVNYTKHAVNMENIYSNLIKRAYQMQVQTYGLCIIWK